MNQNLKIAYFGGEPIGTPVLEELKACGITPSLIVCNPDRPSGRGKKLTPPPVKVWAEKNNLEVWQPESLKDQVAVSEKLQSYDLFVVVAYNKIFPSWLIELPKYKTINLHPSLLPKLRGMSPIRTAILEDQRDAIGVSIMLLDEAMDHGPLLEQKALPITDDNWPIDGNELDEALARLGGATLAYTIENWAAGTITPQTQDHDAATYTKKLTKELGALELDITNLPTGAAAYQTLLKIRGLAGWPGTYFMHRDKRIKILAAHIENDQLAITQVTPEGKSPMSFADYCSANV